MLAKGCALVQNVTTTLSTVRCRIECEHLQMRPLGVILGMVIESQHSLFGSSVFPGDRLFIEPRKLL